MPLANLNYNQKLSRLFRSKIKTKRQCWFIVVTDLFAMLFLNPLYIYIPYTRHLRIKILIYTLQINITLID